MVNQEMTYSEAKNYLLHCVDEAKSKDWASGIKFALATIEKATEQDCISRQAVLETIFAECSGTKLDIDFAKVLILQRAIKALQSVTPQPKIGHWVEENINEWSRKVFCSECGCPPPFEHVSNGDIYSASGYGVNNKTKFCPNCGTKMESEE